MLLTNSVCASTYHIRISSSRISERVSQIFRTFRSQGSITSGDDVRIDTMKMIRVIYRTIQVVDNNVIPTQLLECVSRDFRLIQETSSTLQQLWK